MQVKEDIPLAPFTTFRMGPRARYLIDIDTKEEVSDAFAFIKEKNLPFLVLGGGSNTIFTDTDTYPGVVLRMQIRGFEVDEEVVSVGAGESWDEVVERTVDMGLSGIEALSAIPGSAGAAPVQNIGAYGQELETVFESADVYDRETGAFTTLSKQACGFTYRDSLFRRTNRYVVTGITLRLSKGAPAIPNYADPLAYFSSREIAEPSLKEIREAIIEIRSKKLPDPRDVASVGSFFENPLVSAEHVERLTQKYERPVVYPMPDGRYKVGAGWMLETLGFKGRSFGRIGLYEHHALVVVNRGGATYKELAAVVDHLKENVRERFGIELEPEPVFV